MNNPQVGTHASLTPTTTSPPSPSSASPPSPPNPTTGSGPPATPPAKITLLPIPTSDQSPSSPAVSKSAPSSTRCPKYPSRFIPPVARASRGVSRASRGCLTGGTRPRIRTKSRKNFSPTPIASRRYFFPTLFFTRKKQPNHPQDPFLATSLPRQPRRRRHARPRPPRHLPRRPLLPQPIPPHKRIRILPQPAPPRQRHQQMRIPSPSTTSSGSNAAARLSITFIT